MHQKDVEASQRSAAPIVLDVATLAHDVVGIDGQLSAAATTENIAASVEGKVGLSPEMWEVFVRFKSFMFSDVYTNPRAKGEEGKVDGIMEKLYEYYLAHPETMPADYREIAEREGVPRAAVDYISGMTDSYAIEKYGELFIPFAWTVK